MPGSKQALRSTTVTPPGRGSDPVEVRADGLDVLRDNGDVIVLHRRLAAARRARVRPGPDRRQLPAEGLMRPFGDRVPAWPPLAGVSRCSSRSWSPRSRRCRRAPGRDAGLERSSPAIVLLAAVLTAVGIVVVCACSRGSRPVTARTSSACGPPTSPRAAPAGGGGGRALGIVAVAWAVLGDLEARSTYSPRSTPARSRRRSTTCRCAGPSRPAKPDRLGARGLRSFLHGGRDPAARLRVPRPVRLEGADPGRGDRLRAVRRPDDPRRPPRAAVLSMLLGLVLCALYVATGSLLPGIALASAAPPSRSASVRAAPAAIAGPGARLRARR